MATSARCRLQDATCRALVAVLAFAMLTGCQQPAAKSAARSHTLPLDHLPALAGDFFEMQSAAVGRPFHIYVRFPAGYNESPDTHYPVVYLLDGDSLFPIPAAGHLFLHYGEGVPEAIVVGIACGTRDLPALRESALQWFDAWMQRSDAPWILWTATIAGGTHAADSPNSYRLAMVWLFGPHTTAPSP